MPPTVAIEVNVICSRDTIDHIAGRIERAYRRRNPNWAIFGADRRVWESAASRLLEASGVAPSLPVDPELFVAVLAPGRRAPDPWIELTPPSSGTRYLHALRRIVGRLRRELKAELRLADGRLAGGMPLDELLEDRDDRISPLARYIVASRAGRFDHVLSLLPAAQAQHRSCPLYRQAARPLLPGHAYPCNEPDADPRAIRQDALQFSLN